MKGSELYKAILIVVFLMIMVPKNYAQNDNGDLVGDMNFYEIVDYQEKKWEDIPIEERNGWKQFKRWEAFWGPRVYPTGEFPSYIDVVREYYKYQENTKIKYDKNLSNTWDALGPFKEPIDNQSGIGRVNIVRFHPDNPNEIWIGAAAGGAWFSKDAGQNWTKVPFTQFLSLGISDIAFSESNPDVMYMSTGDVFGSASSRDFYSIGVIKSVDGGNTWQVTSLAYELEDNISTAKLLVDPRDANIVTVATSRGIWRTIDGGSTWDQRFNGRAFIDMEYKADDHNIMIASTYGFGGNSGIYRSTDAGESWNMVISEEESNRVAIEVSPSNPNFMYAIFSRRGFNSLHSFKQSIDGGITWQDKLSYETNGINILGRSNGFNEDATVGQGQYDLCLAVNPDNHLDVYVGGINTWRTRNGGTSWTLETHWFGGFGAAYVHADIHDLKYSDDGQYLYSANDGGLDRLNTNNGRWTRLDDGLNIMQYYRFNSSAQDDMFIIAGSQDNGTSMLKNGQWYQVGGGDGMDCAIDPENPNILYSSIYYGSFSRSVNGGNSFQFMLNRNVTGENADWTAPLAVDQNNPNYVYAGFENVWRSTNRGGNWARISSFGSSSAILKGISIAPSDGSVIYAFTNTVLRATFNNGTTWDLISSFNQAITDVEVDPINPRKIWITTSGFSDGNKVYEYDGENMRNISGNLPNVPVNAITYQPNSPDRLYVGTEIGVYYTDNGSSFWLPYNDGLPNVIIYDMEVHEKTNKLRIGTFGMGIWEVDLLECFPEPITLDIQGETTICEGETVMLTAMEDADNYLWSNGETTKSIEVTEEGTYSVISEDANGCYRKSPSIEIDVTATPDLNINWSGSLCRGGEVELSAGFGFLVYEWSTGEKGTRRITITEPTENVYMVGTTADGCKVYSDTFNIRQLDPPPVPEIIQINFQLLAPEGYAHYQWYKDGREIINQNDRIYIFEEGDQGDYQVEVFDDQGCGTKSENYQVFTSVEDAFNSDDNRMTISPNPTSGQFRLTFETEQSSNYELNIVNALGMNIYSAAGFSNSNILEKDIDLTNAPKGAYFIRIKSGMINYSKKLILN